MNDAFTFFTFGSTEFSALVGPMKAGIAFFLTAFRTNFHWSSLSLVGSIKGILFLLSQVLVIRLSALPDRYNNEQLIYPIWACTGRGLG